MLKYNWPVIGHQAIIKYLQAVIANQSLNQVYLFYGPNGVGKNLVAKYFIQTLYCQSNKARPCQVCNYCQQINKAIHPDVIYLESQINKKNITIEQIREVKEKIQRSSFLNSYKIVLIQDAQKLSLAASNALLKILEEPSPQTIFIFITSDITALPKTILSRSQLIKFLPVGNHLIKQALIQLGANRSLAQELAHLSGGLPGKVLPFIKHSQNLISFKDETQQLLNALATGISERFLLVKQLTAQAKSENGRLKIKAFLNRFILLMRDILLTKNSIDRNLIHFYLKDGLKEFAQYYSNYQIIQFIRLAQYEYDLLEQNISPRLLLENLMLSLEIK